MTDGATPESTALAINTLRFLAVDMVEQAKSGHPGAPLGQAALGYTLWTRFLRHDPTDPAWPGRDRFVLSCGHASALLYGLLHLAGFDLPLAELERFRQLGSKTPGHPEYGHTVGVETTTGPLGQGLATAVGMAVARRMLADRYDRDGFHLFDYRIWVLASDGDLMEGVAAEASSLAGHLKLGALKVFYDDNRITIDGSTDLAFTENVAQRYESYGWRVLTVADGNDVDELTRAARIAEEETERPTLVVVRTHIGYGSPNRQDTSKAHGEPLGPDEAGLTKDALGWPREPRFLVPDAAREAFRPAARRGAEAHRAWRESLARFNRENPALGDELGRRLRNELPAHWQDELPSFGDDEKLATRAASGRVLNALAQVLPELVGGSADLAGSNNTMIKGGGDFQAGSAGRNLYFGVREHAMGAVLNGMALSGMFRPYGGTFLIFSDFLRPAIRLAALMGLPAIYVFTHDSIFLGEDGPTHQPVEQLLALRAIPNLTVLRPADARETAAAWRVALERHSGPTVLALTRQALPTLPLAEAEVLAGVARGAYVVADWSAAAAAERRAILLATGSEVSLALAAKQAAGPDGEAWRVVSFPAWDLFEQQDAVYRQAVLPPDVTRRLAIETGVTLGWSRYVGPHGDVLGIDTFGASGPQADLARHFGFTTDAVSARLKALG
ncbi:MAG: transketolase [Thermoanaerobaculia bacterium]|nr:transketolase [Thermoanaerobaculia bacterium]